MFGCSPIKMRETSFVFPKFCFFLLLSAEEDYTLNLIFSQAISRPEV